MLEKIKDISDKKMYIFTVAIMSLTYIFIMFFLHRYISCMLDSDDSSELILARILADENKMLTSKWYYSTEIRCLNTNLVYSFFFKIFTNWHLVRMCSVGVLIICFIASICYLCKRLCISLYFPFITFIILSQGGDYFYFIYKVGYYIPHIAILFLGLGFVYAYNKSDAVHKIYIGMASFVLSFVSCLGGPRQLIILYLPLILTTFLLVILRVMDGDKIKNYYSNKYNMFYFSLITFLGGVGGYIYNCKVLAEKYHFKSWDSIQYRLFDGGIFFTVINDFLKNYGYICEKVSIKSTYCNCISVICFFISIVSVIHAIKYRKTVKFGYLFLASFYVVDLSVFLCIYTFTNMQYESRYNLPVIILSYFLIFLFIREKIKNNNTLNIIIIGCTILFLIRSGIFYYSLYEVFASKDYVNEKAVIAEKMVNNGYLYGYGTFWNANVLTELSDGQIEMHHWCDTGRDCNGDAISSLTDINQTFKWLQKVSHDDVYPYGQKCFIILSQSEFDKFEWKEKMLDDELLYCTDQYVVYGYDTYEIMIDSLYS